MDIVNFPGIIAEHGLLNSGDVNLAKDLILIGKQMGPQRDGTQYENMAITVAQFANIVSGGGNETLAQTLVLGNVTGGTNIIFSGTDFAIFQSGAFSGRLSRLPLTGNQAWNLPDKSGTIALLSDIPAPTPPQSLSSVLGVGNTTGPINISIDSGQGITYNQGLASVLLSTPTTANQVWLLPDASGTIALLSDIPAVTNIYTNDGTIASATRNVTINTTLNFLHGAAGVNGSVQMSTGGYFKNQTSIATNYWEYNNTTGIMSFVTDTHTVTGVRAENGGGVGNPTSLVELFAGSNGTAYLNIGSTTSRFDFYTNNTGIFAGTLDGPTGNWGFGGLNAASTKVTINGIGNTVTTTNQLWRNLSGTHLMSLTDNGELKFNSLAETFLVYNGGLGRYEIGNAVRQNLFVGTDHIFPNTLWYNTSRAGATGDTGHNLGLYTLTSRSLGDAINPQLHHYFNTVGATHPDSVLGRFANNGTQHFEVYGNGRIWGGNIPVYANDAAAGVGGLTAGFWYQTATGELRIKI